MQKVAVILGLVFAVSCTCERAADAFATVYGKWKQEQIRAIVAQGASMNGMRPAPESNGEYKDLRDLGPKVLPRLVKELDSELLGRPSDPNSSESIFSFYLAYLVADIAGCNLNELYDRDEPARFVIERYRRELHPDGWKNLGPPPVRDLDYWKRWQRLPGTPTNAPNPGA